MSVTINGTTGITSPGGDVSTSLATGALTVAGNNISAVGGFQRNRIINGAMGIWQRGTSFSVVATAAYSADRWQIYQPSGTGTITQETDVPSGFKYSLKAVGAGTDVLQRIESANTADLVGEPVTISFWLKQTVGAGTGSITVQTQHPTASDNWTGVVDISSQTITPTSSWARYSLTFTNLPSGVANGYAINIFPTSGGSSSTFYITGVQLEAGSVATPFEYRQYGQELALCQRYYQLTGAGSVATCWGAIFGVAASNLDIHVKTVVPMRSAPSSPSLTSGTAAVASAGNAGVNFTQTGTFWLTPTHVGLTGSISSGGVAGLVFYLSGDIAQLNAEL